MLLAACSVAQSGGQETSADSPLPKLVLQFGHTMPVEAVAWLRGKRNLVSLGKDGSIVVWDVASRNIVNRAQLPVNWTDLGIAKCIRLVGFDLDEDAETLTVSFALDLVEENVSELSAERLGHMWSLEDIQKVSGCPGLGKNANWYAYAFDTKSWALKSGGPGEIPDSVPHRSFSIKIGRDFAENSEKQTFEYPTALVTPDFFPLPRDRSLRPEPNYDDGKIGKPSFGSPTCLAPDRCRYGVNLVPTGKQGATIVLNGRPRSNFIAADVSPDGLRLVRVDQAQIPGTARADVFNLIDGTSWDSLLLRGSYRHARWLPAKLDSQGKPVSLPHFALFSDGYAFNNATGKPSADFPPVTIVDEACADLGKCNALASYSGMEPLDGKGSFVGIANLEGCASIGQAFYSITPVICPPKGPYPAPEESTDFSFVPPPPFTPSLSLYSAQADSAPGSWRLLDQPGLKDNEEITAVKLSPDGKTLAVAIRTNHAPKTVDELMGYGASCLPDQYLCMSDQTQVDKVFLYQFNGTDIAPHPREIVEFSEPLYASYVSVNEGLAVGDPVVKAFFAPGLHTDGGIDQLGFTPDGSRLFFMKRPYQSDTGLGADQSDDGERLYVFDTSADSVTKVGIQFDLKNLSTQPDKALLKTKLTIKTSGAEAAGIYPFRSSHIVGAGSDKVFGLDNRKIIELSTGKILAQDMADTPLNTAGYIAKSNLLWGASADGAIRFWSAEDGALMLTLYIFPGDRGHPGNRFFAVTPEGRYDTNLLPDSNLIRWLVPDAPWQSLAAQTFMRDYFDPGLYRKLLDCRAAAEADAKCDKVFKPLPPIASLNRVLPSVRIGSISRGEHPNEVKVSVTVTEGQDPFAANGKTRSGIYGLRLFRNGRQVAMTPTEFDRVDNPRQDWRKSIFLWRFLNLDSNRNPFERLYDWIAGIDRKKEFRTTFTVPLPTGSNAQAPQVFSAYAFNEDRIKSETASLPYAPPAEGKPRPRKAYILAIGINPYFQQHSLHYSLADAELMADTLSRIPGFQPVVTVLGKARDGRATSVYKQMIVRAVNRVARLATPDDIVIITYSGHGWADPHGNFFLAPSGANWPKGWKTLDKKTMLSSDMLSNALRSSQAGEIALIIDACQSAASVDTGGFKPAPMGDAGLGQLAYDKGILILAAAQPDANAQEQAALQHGLLTYALAGNGEGLAPGPGHAPTDRHGMVHFDDWLKYAVGRVPSLVRELQLEGATVHGQVPSLFDFNRKQSPLVLKPRVLEPVTASPDG